MVPHDVGRRTSPWTVGFELLGFAFALPLAALAAVHGDPGDAAQVALGALVFLYRAVAWWFRTYAVADDHLLLEEGILNRRHRTVPYRRVQQVDLQQHLLHRLVGVAAVRIETAGEGGATAIALKVLRREDAAALRELVLARRSEPVPGGGGGEVQSGWSAPAPPPPRVAIARLSIGRVALAAATELGVAIAGALLLPVGLALVAASPSLVEGRDALAAGLGAVLAWIGGGSASLIALRVVAGVLADGGYSLEADGQDLHLRRGLLQVREQTIPRARIQQVTVIDNPVRRALGIASVVLHSAAGSAAVDGQSNALRVPLVRAGDVGSTVLAITGPQWEVPALHPRSAVARRRAVVRRVVLLLLMFGPTVVLTPVALLGVPWGRAAHRRAGYGASATVASFASGVLHHRLTLVPRSRIQSARTTASPFQRRLGLRTAWLDVAGGTSRGALTANPHLHDLEAAVADAAMRSLAVR